MILLVLSSTVLNTAALRRALALPLAPPDMAKIPGYMMGLILELGWLPIHTRAASHLAHHCCVDFKIQIRSLKAKQELERSVCYSCPAWLPLLHRDCWTRSKIAPTAGRMAGPGVCQSQGLRFGAQTWLLCWPWDVEGHGQPL